MVRIFAKSVLAYITIIIVAYFSFLNRRLFIDRTITKDEYASLHTVIKRMVEDGNTIITPSIIDKGYLDMAINMYKTSILPHGLEKKTLFMCVDQQSCLEAKEKSLPVYMYKDFSKLKTNVFNSKEFKMKAMIKHFIVAEVIKYGYNILLTDIDMFWFRNPLHEVMRVCGNCDFAIQNEANRELNIGFMYVRPTNNSLKFFQKLINQSKRKSGQGAQAMFGAMVKKFKKDLNYKVLSLKTFPDGLTYFEKGNRIFPRTNPCNKCFICHNNWIVGTEAKIFRFKEHIMWRVDTDGYYSDIQQKYLIFYNFKINMTDMRTQDLNALRAALSIGKILNRKVILPERFNGKKNQMIPLNGLLRIRTFDSIFRNNYRESSFLNNPLVPQSTKNSFCGLFEIKVNSIDIRHENKNMHYIYPKDQSKGATEEEIRIHFDTPNIKRCKVIAFAHLYNSFKDFSNKSIGHQFFDQFAKSFRKSSYRQLDILKG